MAPRDPVDRKYLGVHSIASSCQPFTLGRRCRREGSSSPPADCLPVRRKRRDHPQLCALLQAAVLACPFVGAESCVNRAGADGSRSAAVQVNLCCSCWVRGWRRRGQTPRASPARSKPPTRTKRNKKNHAYVCANTHVYMLRYINLKKKIKKNERQRSENQQNARGQKCVKVFLFFFCRIKERARWLLASNSFSFPASLRPVRNKHTHLSPRSRAQKPAPWSLRRLRAAAALPFSSGSKVLGREGLGGEAAAGPQRRDLRDFEEMKSMVGWRDR